MTSRLSDLQPGEAGRVLNVGGEAIFRRRIQEMGVVLGNPIEVLSVAPFGGPIKLRVPNYALSIRRADAALVTVEIQE